MIGERFNFEDVFFRDLTLCVLDTLEGEIKWVNKFSSGDRVVNVPFYYSMTGDERFLLDSFTDDVVSNSRYVDLNTDIIPRGHLTLTSYEIRADEFANPNVWLKMVVENNDEIRNMLTKVRAIPITAKYDLVLHLSSEIDTFKCSQAIMDTLWLYRYMYFEYNFMNIDAVMQIPDSNNIEINREKSLTSDNTIKLTVSFDVQTYYPAFRKPKFPDTVPYTIDSTEYNNQTISVKVELFRPTADYANGSLASSNLIIQGEVPTSQIVTIKTDYPEPNTNIIEDFVFTTTNTNDQANELKNYINSQTEYTAKSSGSNVKITAPPGSSSAINNKDLVLNGVFDQISVTPFAGGGNLSLATCSISFGDLAAGSVTYSLYSGYPNPNTILINGFTFGATTSSQQKVELANLINSLTEYSANNFGSSLTIIGPSNSGGAINSSQITLISDLGEIASNPFVGGGNILVATCSMVFNDLIPNSRTYTLFSNYPNPNTELITGFTFSATTSSGQVVELSNLINSLTDYSASSFGPSLVIDAPVNSGISINDAQLILSNDLNEVLVNPFSGGSDINESAIDVVYSESHLITTSSDGSMVIPVGAGGKVKGSYLNLNLKDPGLKINVLVDPNLGSEFEKIISGDNLEIKSNNIVDDLNQFSSNAFSVAGADGDFRDIITLPKRTRWYNNMIELKNSGKTTTTTPYSSQDLNNQKKL